MIIRAKTVVTMDGPPIDDGAVRVDGDRIVEVGKFSDLYQPPPDSAAWDNEQAGKTASGEEIVDLGEQVLLPGLINAHCHLDYTCLRDKIPPQDSFTDWIRAINAEKAKLTPGDFAKSIMAGFAECRKFGTTAIVNFEAFPELIIRLKPPIRTWWLAELIDVRDPNRPEELAGSAMNLLGRPENKGFAPHAPFTASLDLYRVCQENARHYDWLLSTHLAESRDEFSMFRDGSGPLYDFVKAIGRKVRDCGDATPLAYMLRQIALDERWLVVHLNELDESDFELLAGLTERFHVVHCPRSHMYLEHSRFQFERLRNLGFNVCLGTDSLASNDDLSLFAEMRAFRKSFPDVPAEEVLSMVTLNAARAVGKSDALGRIRANYFADMIAVPLNSSAKNIFDKIIAFNGPVSFSMINGIKDTFQT